MKKIETTLQLKVAGDDCTTIDIDYQKICDKILKRCKRNESGLITDESLINTCMELFQEDNE